jgi:transmembrane sensor
LMARHSGSAMTDSELPPVPPQPDRLEAGLLDRYLAGSATPDERTFVERWVAADPARAVVIARLRMEAGGVQASAGPRSVDDVWARVAGEIDQRDQVAAHVRPLRPTGSDVARAWSRGTAGARWQRVATFVAGAAAAAVLAVLVARVPASRFAQSDAPTYRTDRGQRETITLADGTELTLAPGSRVRLGAGYGQPRRELWLDGEAMFVVVHDATRPFVVRTANAVTVDVGTRFVVRAYPEDRSVRVAVVDGAVALSDSGVGAGVRATLRPGMVGRVEASGVTTVAQPADIEAYTAWTHGELVFDKTPVRGAIAELARWYGVDIELADSSVAHGTITGSFEHEPVDDVLKVVAATIGATVRHDGTRVVFARPTGGA